MLTELASTLLNPLWFKAGPGRAGPGRAGPGQARLGQAGPGRADKLSRNGTSLFMQNSSFLLLTCRRRHITYNLCEIT